MHIIQKSNISYFAVRNYGRYKPNNLYPRLYSQNPISSLRDRLQVNQNNRLSTLNEEFQRLISSETIRERIYDLNNYYGGLSKNVLVAFGRSLELNISDTHYVCWHSACRKELPLRILFTELFFNTIKEPPLNFEILLRHPSLFSNTEKSLNIDWFKKNITGIEDKTDEFFRTFLISADYCWGNEGIDESAVSFLLSPKKLSYKTYEEAKSTVIKSIFPKLKDAKLFTEKFDAITSEVYREDSFDFGDLYAICIPKADFNDLGYISRPYGIPAILRESVECELERGQNNKSFIQNNNIFQLRLLAQKVIPISTKYFNKLNPNMATLIFPTLPDEEYYALKQKIRNLIE